MLLDSKAALREQIACYLWLRPTTLAGSTLSGMTPQALHARQPASACTMAGPQ